MGSQGGRRRSLGPFTLERAILVALLLHLLTGVAFEWWPGTLLALDIPPADEMAS